MWTDALSAAEAEFTRHAVDVLSTVDWAEPLLARLAGAGGLKSSNMPLMFEVRFAYELHRAGARADYEFSAGIGNSTVDFRVDGSPGWLVELVSIRESRGLQSATTSTGTWYEQVLVTDAPDPHHSEEAEMITTMGRIAGKVWAGGAPTKFPPPSSRIHAILVDMRGYLGCGGDAVDYAQMANGAAAVAKADAWKVHHWDGQPIRGLFEQVTSHPLGGAEAMRQRIHFVGFVAEKEYREGEIPARSCFRPNPHLLPVAQQEGKYLTYALAHR